MILGMNVKLLLMYKTYNTAERYIQFLATTSVGDANVSRQAVHYAHTG